MIRARLRGGLLAGGLAMFLGGGCAAPPTSLPDCGGLGPGGADHFDQPVESTKAGACLAARAQGGDATAALVLGDRYRLAPGPLPRIDRNGRQIHWYRLAANSGSALGAWRAAQVLDGRPDRLMPADALAYLTLAIRRQVPEAVDYLVAQWRDGRIDPDTVWTLQQWAGRPGNLPGALRARLVDGLGRAHRPLRPM